MRAVDVLRSMSSVEGGERMGGLVVVVVGVAGVLVSVVRAGGGGWSDMTTATRRGGRWLFELCQMHE